MKLSAERDAGDPRRRDRDDLPGPDDRADARSTRVGWQIAEQLRAHEELTRRQANRRGRRAPRRGRDLEPRAARGRLPAPVLGRDAPARDDRDGALVQPVAPDRGRADDRARRHDPGADPRPDEAPPERVRLLDPDHHPRHGRRRRPRRADRRDVRGPRGRGGPEVGDLPRHAASLHLGAARLDPARRPAARPPARRDSRRAALAPRSRGRLPVRAPLPAPLRALRDAAGAAASGSARAIGTRAISTRRCGRRCGPHRSAASRSGRAHDGSRRRARAARGGRPRQALPGALDLRPPRAPRVRPRGRRRLARGPARRDARHRRRVGLREVDPRPAPGAAARADERDDPLRRHRHHRRSRGASCGRSAARCR